jgi:hypothetical protein
VPRRGTKKKRSGKGSAPVRAPRERSEPNRRRPGTVVDQEVLKLRETGSSYSSIARQLELRRATDAHRAFARAVHSLNDEERQRVTRNEGQRLDQLEIRIRHRDAAAPEKIERRLAAVGALRAALD